MNIQEDYVSFEIAKLLKEKGFCENTEHEIWYVIKQFSTGYHWNSCTYKIGNTTREYNDDCCIPMPTLQMAIKWLRKVHNIHIWAEPNHDKEGLYNAHVKVGWWSNNWAGIGYNTHEKASEEAIKYCLENLI